MVDAEVVPETVDFEAHEPDEVPFEEALESPANAPEGDPPLEARTG